MIDVYMLLVICGWGIAIWVLVLFKHVDASNKSWSNILKRHGEWCLSEIHRYYDNGEEWRFDEYDVIHDLWKSYDMFKKTIIR